MELLKLVDWLVMVPLIVVFGLGCLVLFSIEPSLSYNQLLFFVFGLIGFLVSAKVGYQLFGQLYFAGYLLTIVLLVLTLVLGQITRGAARWLTIGGFGFQPSEIAKPLLILFFAGWSSCLDTTKVKNVLTYLLALLVPAGLIFLQPDLGNSAVIVFIGLIVLFCRGIKREHFWLGLIILLFLLPLSWPLLKPYQQARIVSFINPEQDALGRGYNLIQAKITVGSGRIFGKGLGRGSQGQLRFLPERHSDFIFACLAEELGLIGASLVIFCLFFITWRLLGLARESDDQFGSLVAVGTAALIFFQSFVNIGMNLGVMPITGLTLPLVSYGGSSLLSTMVALGLSASVARQARSRVIEIK